ncbi:MAG: gliding motility-associated C-terminal domain-containing protein [Flavobacteriales bacterium]|nr:gliding motility-associated C-terminal domain-containing protein [Flavobacteriales bacterium]
MNNYQVSFAINVKNTILPFLLVLAINFSAFSQDCGCGIQVSEVQFNPGSTLEDQRYREWVELHNAGNQPVDLTGFYLETNGEDIMNAPNYQSDELVPWGTINNFDPLDAAGGALDLNHDMILAPGEYVIILTQRYNNAAVEVIDIPDGTKVLTFKNTTFWGSTSCCDEPNHGQLYNWGDAVNLYCGDPDNGGLQADGVEWGPSNVEGTVYHSIQRDDDCIFRFHSGGKDGFGIEKDDDGSILASNTPGSANTNTICQVCPASISCTLDPIGITCFGDDNGELELNVYGTDPNYNIDWSSGGINETNTPTTNFTFTLLGPDTYTVTITDALGETSSCEAIIAEPDPIILSETHLEETNCGDGDGSIDITIVSGGTFNPASIVFNGAGGDITASKDVATNFPITVSGIAPANIDETTIASVCVDLVTVPKDKVEKHRFILVNPCGGTLDLKSKANPGGTDFVEVCFEPGAASNITTAASPYTGTWLPEGGNLDAVGGPLTGCDPNGDWSFRIINGENSAGEVRDWSITLNNVGGGSSNYEWASTDGSFVDLGTEDLIGLSPGTYTVTVTDDNGCTESQEATLTPDDDDQDNDGILDAEECNGDLGDTQVDGNTIIVSGVSGAYTGSVGGFNDGTITDATFISKYGAGISTFSTTRTFTFDEPLPPNTYFISIDVDQVTENMSFTGDLLGAEYESWPRLHTQGQGAGSTIYNQGAQTVSMGSLGDWPAVLIDASGVQNITITTVGGIYGWISSRVCPDFDGDGMLDYLDLDSDNDGCPDAIEADGGIVTGDLNPDGSINDAEDGCGVPDMANGGQGGDGQLDSTVVSALCGVECTLNVTSDFNGADISCFGESDGELTLDISGGIPNYEIVWSSVGTNIPNPGTSDLSIIEGVFPDGTYEVTVTDDSDNTATCSATLVHPTEVVAIITDDNEPRCNGGRDGNATVAGTFGIAGYTYLWDTNASAQTTAQATGLDAGTYTVIVFDVNLCTATTSVTIGEPTQLIVVPVVTDISCNGGANGAISLTVTEATPTYTYIWSTLETTDNISGLDAAGAPYSVTVTDANGCSVIESGSPAEPVVIDYATDYLASTCSQQDGEAFIINGAAGISGGTSPYTYLWSDVSTNTNTNLVFAGTYTVTVTDNANCTSSVIQVVQDAGAPTASILDQTIAVDCFEDCDGFITVQFADGAPSYTVAWPSGASSVEAVAGSVTENNLCAGNYIITITDNNDCIIEVPATITEPSLLEAAIIDRNDPLCFGGSDGNATVGATGGTLDYAYLWNNPTAQTDAQAIGLSANIACEVLVTDANGCTATAVETLDEPDEITSDIDGTPLTCFGSNDGAVSLTPAGGTGAYSYVWSNGGSTTKDLINVAGNTYDVTITDVNGCLGYNSFFVDEPDVVTATASTVRHSTCDEDCFDGEVTSAGIGGDEDYTYLWGDPANSITVGVDGVEEGTYCVTITDGNDCAASNCAIVLGEPGMIWVEEITHILCYDQLTGEIALTNTEPGNGPVYTFNWTGPDNFTSTDQDLTGLADGTYNVTIYDRLLVWVSYEYIVNEPTELQFSCSGVGPLCFEGTDGDVEALVSGGTSPYHYLWDNADADTTATVDTFGAGIYNVILTDNNGCELTCSTELIDPDELTVDIIDPKNSDCGTENGSLTADPNGGTGGYSYLWDPTDLTIVTPITLASGTHTVVVTDGNGCTASNKEALLLPGGLNPAFTLVTNVSCNGGSDGVATVDITGGASPYSYSWSTGGSDSGVGVGDVSTDNLFAGDISITVIDADLCEFTIDTLIAEPDILVTTASADSLLCYQDSTAIIKTATIGGSKPYTFVWNNPTASTDTFAIDVPGGTYTVTVADDNDCVATSSIYIDPLTRVVAALSHDTVTCYEAEDGVLYAGATGGVGNYIYQWFLPNPDSVITPNVFEDILGNNDTAYWVIAVDSNMCISDTVFEFVSRPDSIRAHIIIDGEPTGATPFEAVFIDSSYGNYYNMSTWLIDDEVIDINIDTLINTFSVSTTTSSEVILQVSRDGFCAEIDTAFIVVEAGSFLSIPDVFTPNGDEYNEKFMVTYLNICELTGRIFNRWGEKLSQWEGVETGWDGRTFAGEEVPDGVYFYIIDAIGCDGKEYFDNVGSVTIIR